MRQSSNPRDAVLRKFGFRVRELRTALGFSQEQFALECGLDRTYVGGIERGERNIGLLNIALIARTLRTTMSDLLRGVD